MEKRYRASTMSGTRPMRPRRAAAKAKAKAKAKATATASLMGGTESAPYAGASGRRSLRNWLASGGDADSVLLDSLPQLRNRSEDDCRNNPAARAVIKRITSGAVGSGLLMRSVVDRRYLGLASKEAREWGDQAERLFRFWAGSKECSFTRTMTFGQIQNLAFASQKKRGDVFVLMPWDKRKNVPFDLRLQLVEADRVTNPNDRADDDLIAGGIERDSNGVPVAIHIQSVHPGNLITNKLPTWQRIPIYGRETGRRQVLHLMDFERIDQSRGEPVLTPILTTTKQLARFSDAELSAAVINAILAVFVKRTPEAAGLDAKGQEYSADQRERWKNSDLELGSGTWIEGAPGEELQTVTSNRPSSQFEAFYASCMKQIGMAVGVPYEVLVQNFQSSYSASRAALLEFYKAAKIERDLLKVNLCQVVYEEFLIEAVVKGFIHAPGFLTDPFVRAAYCQTDWIGPSMGQIDPLKEATAANMRVKCNFSTGGRESAELTGMDYEQIVYTREEEREVLAEAGLSADGDEAQSDGKYPSDKDE